MKPNRYQIDIVQVKDCHNPADYVMVHIDAKMAESMTQAVSMTQTPDATPRENT